jgi:hypothetical protein
MALNPRFTSELPGNFKKLEFLGPNTRDSELSEERNVMGIFLSSQI